MYTIISAFKITHVHVLCVHRTTTLQFFCY